MSEHTCDRPSDKPEDEPICGACFEEWQEGGLEIIGERMKQRKRRIR